MPKEGVVTTTVACRRRHTRYEVPPGTEAAVEFPYPGPHSDRFEMPLRDISASGLSFELTLELPGLEAGKCLGPSVISFGQHRIRADLLVMHMTPDAGIGSTCGVLVYPARDSDLLTLQSLILSLD